MKKIRLIAAVLMLSLLAIGCSGKTADSQDHDKINIVTTTTMLTDLVQTIGGEHVSVKGLMGTGVDPHLYQASAGDVIKMQEADMVVYTGLHLEGKMGDVFASLDKVGKDVIAIENGLDESRLIVSDDDGVSYDPHIWFDVANWKAAAKEVTKGLIAKDPTNEADYQQHLTDYLVELDELEIYIEKRVAELSEDQRILVTAHDAFEYFGQAYDFKVVGIQGISTVSEAGTGDVSEMANFIVKHHVKAIFVESSVSPKTIQALQAAVKAKGAAIEIGGELYSDSLGDKQSGDETYIKTFKKNVDIIVDSLK
ncbi:metal ABC transporter solute-binding protein, Zn/Mn family [Isobaculum melis]|uniref:Manganese/zinc/iron transport system substrate-binding protein n=1 Tax=Isobaculum melis TaxID=142588 RepID=A0A1H9R3H7_9LACT|nr:zinc ABC transporter substrate-binding protein [Isobaculum melis]SER66599.1 manganese/zinc/iron transport system substrate-binding protein [Isobaculum melis]